MPSRARRIREALSAALAQERGLVATTAAADRLLRDAVGAQGSAWGTVDPATTLSTSCARFGALGSGPDPAADARERRLFELEWADDAPNTFWALGRAGRVAAALRQTVAAPQEVPRFTELLAPAGVHDELRMRLDLDGQLWGTAVFYRFSPEPFTADDVAVAAAAAPVVAWAVRTALLAAACDSARIPVPPGSLLLDADDRVQVTSPAAEHLLGELPDEQVATALRSLGAAARARGQVSLTVSGPAGVIALHGSPAKGADGALAVVVERPRPAELAPLIMRASGFTARERVVTEAVLHGAPRNQIARRLRITEHTLGDHLRSVYRKAGVAGRAELAALLYGRHYESPRAHGAPPNPYGWFIDPGGVAGERAPLAGDSPRLSGRR